MKCENHFCIYEEKGECTLDEILVTATGQCDMCVYPNIDEKVLYEAKSELLERYDMSL